MISGTKRTLYFIALFCLIIPHLSHSQTPEFYRTAEHTTIDFKYASFTVPDEDSNNTWLHVITRIPFSRLQFAEVEGSFAAKYEIVTAVFDSKKNLVRENNLKEEVRVDRFQETIDSNQSHSADSKLLLAPGEYNVLLVLTDLETGNKLNRNFRVEISEYKKKNIKTSSIILLENFEAGSKELLNSKPALTDNLDRNIKQYFAYFEIITDSPDEEYSVEGKIQSVRKRRKVSRKLTKFSKLRGEKVIPVMYEINSLDFPSGAYKIEIEIKSSKKKQKLNRIFTMSWSGVPTNEDDLDDALGQMRYAFQDVMNADLKKMSYDKKMELFKSAWAKRDPSPGSEFNELKSEYFRRVRYADMNFTVFRNGWKTDRGMIYILFGPPNEVTRSNFDSSARESQSWVYYDYNVSFEFYDRDGFGEMYLTTPFDYRMMKRPIK